MSDTWTNPGPGTRVCERCGDVWFPAHVNPILAAGVITLSSDAEYVVRCGMCGGKLKQGLDKQEDDE